jgi:hypothetical protein
MPNRLQKEPIPTKGLRNDITGEIVPIIGGYSSG